MFLARDARLVNWSYVGPKNEHLRGTLKDDAAGMAAIGFQFADRVQWLNSTDPVDAAFRLERHEFRGKNYLQARLVGLAPAAVKVA